MMLNKNKVGLVVGGVIGSIHLCWSFLVAIGLAQQLINLILRLHFLDIPVHIAVFNFTTAIILVVITSILGYIIGCFFSFLWNWLHKR